MTRRRTEIELHPVEVISFVRGDNLATIASDGARHVTQEFSLCKEFSTLKKAIAYLEAKGFQIVTDHFNSI